MTVCMAEPMRMSIQDFGRRLFQSADLDPVYCALNGAAFGTGQRNRWLIAYWLFYNCAFASYASEREGGEFWKLLLVAAENKQATPTGGLWPRGAERRHFRGAAAIRGVTRLVDRYGNNPGGMIDCIVGGPLDVRSIMDRVKQHDMFGDWIAFKVADMVDAVLGIEVDQTDVSVFLYDAPRSSILKQIEAGVIKGIRKFKGDGDLVRAMWWLRDELHDCRVPHKPNSTGPDWFSLETVWCKHGSHMTGHYPLYKDIREINHALHLWEQHSAAVRMFKEHMPLEPPQPGCLL